MRRTNERRLEEVPDAKTCDEDDDLLYGAEEQGQSEIEQRKDRTYTDVPSSIMIMRPVPIVMIIYKSGRVS